MTPRDLIVFLAFFLLQPASLTIAQPDDKPESENGYDHLMAASAVVRAYIREADHNVDTSWIALPGADFGVGPAEMARERRRAVEDLGEVERRGFIEHLTRFAEAQEFTLPPVEEGMEYLPEYTGASRSLAWWLRARAIVGWERKDWNAVTTSLEISNALATRLFDDDRHIHILSGYGVHSMTIDLASSIVLLGDIPLETIESIREVMQGSHRTELMAVVQEHRVWARQSVLNLYKSETELDETLFEEEFPERLMGKPKGWHTDVTVASRTHCVQLAEEFVDGWRANIEALSSGKRPPFNTNAFALKLRDEEGPAVLAIVEAHSMFIAAMRMRMHEDGLRLNLALAEFQARNSGFPDSLDELTPDYLSELPIDPFSGKVYGYFLRRVPPWRAERDLPYEIYSVGQDRTDNLGRFDWGNPGRAEIQTIPIGIFDSPFLDRADPMNYDYPLNLPD